jgi:uncharacterized protein (TIGR02300 family)
VAGKKAVARNAPASKAAAKAKKKKKKKRSGKSSAAKKLELRIGAGRPVAAPSSPLGNKWECFECGAKFYDLNKEEAICPKCSTDQANRPRVSSRPTTKSQPARPAVRPMTPLLDDDDDARSTEESDREHTGVKAPRTGEDFFDDATKASDTDED